MFDTIGFVSKLHLRPVDELEAKGSVGEAKAQMPPEIIAGALK